MKVQRYCKIERNAKQKMIFLFCIAEMLHWRMHAVLSKKAIHSELAAKALLKNRK